uniref:biotin/lipoyl-binding protein n=1 Tax=Falsiroseomonas oryzae TaxID=2766473 RepID=UPI0022EACF62
MRWKLAAGTALIVAAAASGGWALRFRPLAVPVAAIERDVPVRVFGLGTIEARISTRLGFEVAGTVAELRADHGDRVPAGTVLARLNAAAQDARVAKAEAGLQSAEALQGRVAAALERATVLYSQKRATAQRRRELAGRGTTSPEQAELAETEAAAAAADLAVARADLEVARAQL